MCVLFRAGFAPASRACLCGQVEHKGNSPLDPRTGLVTVLLLFLPPVMTIAVSLYSFSGTQSGEAPNEKRSCAGRRHPDQSNAPEGSGNNSDRGSDFHRRCACRLCRSGLRPEANVFHGIVPTQSRQRQLWLGHGRQTVDADSDGIKHRKRRN
jgi:hypothetical protein